MDDIVVIRVLDEDEEPPLDAVEIPALKDMEPEDGAAMFKAGIRIGAALRTSGIKCEGVNLLLNDGAEAGQRVFHSHLHVIPRIVGDSLRRDLNGDIPLRSVLDETAEKIKAVMV